MSSPSNPTNPNLEIVVPDSVDLTQEPKTKFVIVSVDVETTALKLLQGDILSIGACTYWEDDPDRMETFYVNLEPLYGRVDQGTMREFWSKFPERWADTQEDRKPAVEAMASFKQWVDDLGLDPIFMAWPAHFDFMWVDHWFDLTQIENPFSYKPLDQASFACGLIKDWKQVKGSRSKGTLTLPKEWEGTNLVPHNALSDAIAQRNGFAQMMKDVGA